MKPALSLLFIGDQVGEPAVGFTVSVLPQLINQYGADFCVVNGENAHQGRGINDQIVKKLLDAGVDVITGGDHSFDKHLVFPLMARERRLLRPLNYPKGVPGFGFGVYELPTLGAKIAVLNLRGQAYFQNPINDPFRAADWAIGEVAAQTKLIFIDLHAEATAEKAALAHYLDGRASLIAGTHTHVPTADETVLPQGTGFITDVGCTGPINSIIGMDVKTALDRFLLQTPQKYQLAEGRIALCGIHAELDIATGKCLRLQRIRIEE
jgi:metallophosphoesterase (TIGR00282 family)